MHRKAYPDLQKEKLQKWAEIGRKAGTVNKDKEQYEKTILY